MPHRETPLISNRIYYEIISSCNLHCKHCSDLLSDQQGLILSAERILSFHSRMSKKLGCKNSVITGGEPSLHPEFYRIVEGLAEYGNVLITTNGTFLDLEKIAPILDKYKNVTIQVSVDGLSKNRFDAVRGQGSHEKVYSTINSLISMGFAKQVGLSMTIMRDNVNEVLSLIDYCDKKGISYIHFPVLLPVGIALKKWDEIAPEVDMQKQIEDEIFNIVANYKGKLTISSNRLHQIYAKVIPAYASDCLSSFTIKVCPNEYVMPCPAASKVQHRICNINDKNVEDLIIEKLETIKSKSDQYRYEYDVKCDKCDVKNFCKGQFCANCKLLMDDMNHTKEYFCEIISYHINNAIMGG